MSKGKKRCSPESCGINDKIESFMDKFSRISEKLTENQIEMRISIVKLNESLEGVKRLNGRVDDLSEELKKTNALTYKLVPVRGSRTRE